MQVSVVSPRPALRGTLVEEGLAIPEAGQRSLGFGQLRQFFQHDKLVNFLMVLTIIVGFFHGWLKIKFRANWVTFAFDLPLTAAWLLTVAAVGRGRRLFPDCNMSRVLIALTVIGIAYTILPFGVPLVISLASFRAWCFIPLIFLIGYHITRSVRQIEVYLWLLTILGLVTSIYGVFFQSVDEVLEMMKNDPELQFRLANQFYADSHGIGTFRRFSTFVSSASFGGTMAYCATFAVSRLAHPGCSWPERLFLGLASTVMSYGIVMSGSRSAMTSLAVGLGFAIWYRRGGLALLLAPALIGAGLLLGISKLGGGIADRFATLFDPEVILQRLYIVLSPGWENLAQYPMGGGLGRSGHGVPVIMYSSERLAEMRSIDGDMGRIVVDMGIIGLIIFILLVVVGLTDAFQWMKKLRDSPLGVVGLPAGSMFILASLQLTYGSPFLAIPNGVLLWFFLGSMRRLVEDYDKYKTIAGETAADSAPQFASFIMPSRVMPLYQQPKRAAKGLTSIFAQRAKTTTTPLPRSPGILSSQLGSGSRTGSESPGKVATVGSRTTRPSGPLKRFLFRRPDDAPDRRKRR